MDISRTASPDPSESIFSDTALTQLEGETAQPFDLTRLRLERAGSTTSSSDGYNLANLNLVSLNRPWNDNSHPETSRRGFHAISTVLNHPSKRSAPLRASRIPLPPGPTPEVFPKVNRKDIDAYVKAISPEWQRFDEARSLRQALPSNFIEGEPGPRKNREEKDLPQLSQVPEVFFEPDFNIGNPHIFDVVTEQIPPPSANVSTPRKPSSSSSSPTSSSPSFLPTLHPLPSSEPSSEPSSPLPSLTPRASSSAFPPNTPRQPRTSTPPSRGGPIENTTTNQALQGKLTSYLDIVEQHLVLEISRRSSSFFAALTNLQDLQSESSSCLSRIDSLRMELVALDEGQAHRGLEVVRLHRTLGGLKRVEGAVREVRGVEEAVGMIKALVANGDGYGAVEIWEEVDGWVKRKGKGKEREQPFVVVSEDQAGASPNGAGLKQSPSSSPRPSPRSSPRLRPAGLHDLAEEPEDGSEELGPLSSSSSHLVPPRRVSSLASSSPSLPTTQTSSNRHRPSNTASSRYPPTDLTTLSSLLHLPQTLAALALAIATQLESELQAVLTGEMSKPSDPEALEDGLKGRIAPLVESLIRVREGGRLVGVYREVAISEIREAVKKHMPGGDVEEEAVVSTAGEKGTTRANGGGVVPAKAPLAKALQDLDHSEFLAIEKAMFAGLIACVRTIEVFSKAIDSILNDASSPSSSLAASLPSVKGDLSDVLSTASELANSRASKIIGVRNEQHAALKLGQFLEMFSEAWSFVVACEVICRKMIVGLRGTMVVQAKTFLQSYHSQRVSTSARLVENELWAPEETTPSQQHVVDLIVESAVGDPSELVIVSTSSSPSTGVSTPSEPSPSTNGTSNGAAETGNKKHLQIEDRSYFVVGATLGTLELLLDYVKIVINIDLLTTDAMSKIIEFLKSFNSRTCQVVLGAGAMRSAGLKNITAKHLALASQSLSIMIALIPYIREALRRHLNPKQAVMLIEFDKLKRDYQEHQNEIHSKLVAIMGDRLSLHLKALREIEWEAPSRRPGKPNEYIELLVKETTQLHKILSRYLPDQTVDSVSSQVFAAINHGLSEAYLAIEVRSEDAKGRLLLDATHLQSKLSALPNTSPFSNVLVTLVKDKASPRVPLGANMKNLMRRVSQRSDSGGPPSPGAAEKELAIPEGRDLELLGSELGTPLGGGSGLGTPMSELVDETKRLGGQDVEVVVSKPDEAQDTSASLSPASIRLPPSPLPPIPDLPPSSSPSPPFTDLPRPSSSPPPIPPKSRSPPNASDLPSVSADELLPPSLPPKEQTQKAIGEGQLQDLPSAEEVVQEGTKEEEEERSATVKREEEEEKVDV